MELSKGLINIRGQFGKDERMQIISIVCQVNRTIYDAMRTVDKDVHVLVWPQVDIGEDQVDPDDAKRKIQIADLVTEDVSEKIYLLIELYNKGGWEREVQVLNKTADLQYKFPVKGGRIRSSHRLIVSGSKLVILAKCEAHVYNQNGEFERSFEFFKSEGDKYLADCTATYDGRILIRHHKGDFSDYFCVHVFTMEGQEIAKFKSGVGLNLARMLFSPRCAGEHVVIAGYNYEDEVITVELYTVDGKLVRRILLRGNPRYFFDGITVTMEGHIAVFVGGSVVVYKN